jgi:hypothetical protein
VENKDDSLPQADDEKDLEPTPLAVVDAVYEDDADDDDLLDLGIQIGRMRITERIGGFFRPRLAQELEYSLYDTTEKASLKPGEINIAPSGVQTYQYLMPGPAYIAPASGFFFGQADNGSSLIDYLPSRLAADRLIKQYFTAVHSVAQLLHYPSFEKEYENFWEEISLGIEPPASVQAIVFAAMFSGVVSMSEIILLRDFGVPKDRLIDNFKLGTETALSRSHFLRTTKIETLQAFVMYLVSQWGICFDANSISLTISDSTVPCRNFTSALSFSRSCNPHGRMHGSSSRWRNIWPEPPRDARSTTDLVSAVFFGCQNMRGPRA